MTISPLSAPVSTPQPAEPSAPDLTPIPSQPLSSKPTWKEELGIFASTFITIFLAELGDKTQLTTLFMSAQSDTPWIVFTGAALALVATSLVGVLLGRWLAKHISPRTLEISAGLLLLVMSALLVADVIKS